MRIPDYRFTTPIKDQNYWPPKKRRIDKIREKEFGQELEESFYKEKPETKNILPPRYVGRRLTNWA